MREGRKSRVFLTCVLLVWLLLLAFLYGAATSAGEAFAHRVSSGQMLSLGFEKDICFPALSAVGVPDPINVLALVVWGTAFGLPLLSALLIWVLKDIQSVRWWFLFLAVCDVAWVVIVGMTLALGIWVPTAH